MLDVHISGDYDFEQVENFVEERVMVEPKVQSQQTTLEPAYVAETVEKAEEWLSKIDGLVKASSTKWLFEEEPTALDAHVVVFASTMQAEYVGRGAMLPEAVKAFARRTTEGREWVEFEGRWMAS
ncbi:hypothetical protein PRZ48_000136 [Zasmidium cellare]|uniref:GST C-terminal domain-containing protein n=1 Tax=Zasmidium cellare TaxID=395010 RepID=A0ABR0EZ80_ZASCE|nr:hypothetical protein PRZ48_000136 [Zasmidium cellare]